jgi:hypothetical protein
VPGFGSDATIVPLYTEYVELTDLRAAHGLLDLSKISLNRLWRQKATDAEGLGLQKLILRK